MTINHIDQLAEWWDSAEDAPASPGDRIIERHVCERDEDTYYTIGVHREGMRGLIGKSGTRILARAPKPKPAWHDAVAVIAHADDGHIRQVWERDGDTDYWCGTEGYLVRTEKLHDVTPMLEAKVTDDAVARVSDVLRAHYGTHDNDHTAQEVIAAALGIEAE